jgi:TPR repeat protein
MILSRKKDNAAAMEYFKEAAKTGHILALYNLGRMHELGLSVPSSCNIALLVPYPPFYE